MAKQLKQASEAEAIDAFKAWDSSGSGFISTKELASMLNEINRVNRDLRLTKEEIEAMTKEAEHTAGAGKIKFESKFWGSSLSFKLRKGLPKLIKNMEEIPSFFIFLS